MRVWKASDFQVFEDGKPQRIVAFSAESMTPVAVSSDAGSVHAGSGGAAKTSGSSDAPKRTYLILVDTLHSSFANFGKVRASGFTRMIQDSEAANVAVAADQFAGLMREYCSVCQCERAGNTTDQSGCAATKSRVQMFLTSFGERTFLVNQQFFGN